MADPLYSTNLPGLLNELARLTLIKFHEVQVEGEMAHLLIEPKTAIVLPSYFFYMPSGVYYSVAPYYNFFNNLRETKQANFPLLGITGRGTRQLITIGGGISLNVNFRMYLIIPAPPSQQIIERAAYTASHLSRVVLSIFHHPPFWWFIEVGEEDVLTRAPEGDYTISYIGGSIRGCPHFLPAVDTTQP